MLQGSRRGVGKSWSIPATSAEKQLLLLTEYISVANQSRRRKTSVPVAHYITLLLQVSGCVTVVRPYHLSQLNQRLQEIYEPDSYFQVFPLHTLLNCLQENPWKSTTQKNSHQNCPETWS
jgi:hypothetical protein